MSEHTGSGPGRDPEPGDPRDRGPRPHATGRDVFWGLLAVAIGGVTAVQFIGLAIALTRLPTGPSTGGVVLGFLITVVWLLTIYWLTMGAWRRSVWGCPFHHRRAGPVVGRCMRHDLVTDAGVDTDEPSDPATRP